MDDSRTLDQMQQRLEAIQTGQMGLVNLVGRLQSDVALLGHYVYVPNGGSPPILVQLPLLSTAVDGLKLEQTRLGLLLTTESLQKAHAKLQKTVAMIALLAGLLGAGMPSLVTWLLAPKGPPVVLQVPPGPLPSLLPPR